MDYFKIHQTSSTEPCDITMVKYNNSETLNPILETKIRNYGDVVGHKSNVKADMTDFTLYKDPDFKRICDFAIMQCISSIEGLSQRGAEMLRFNIVDCWGMVYKNDQGHHTIEHAHWPATFSFVYYVNACEHCAPLEFTTANYSVKPFSGLMVIFPGNTSHKVNVQNCNHDRIAVSGNVSVTIRKPGETE